MQNTRSTYASLVFFVVITLVTVALYALALYSPENKGTPFMAAMVTSLLALISCTSLTTVYLNSVYNSYLSVNDLGFYGKIETLEYYKGEAGEFLRGVVLFLYVFMGASIIANRLDGISISLLIATTFAYTVYSHAKKFKNYLVERSDKLDY